MTVKANKNNLDLVKELVKLVTENDLTEIEIEQSEKTSNSIYIRVSKTNEKVLASTLTSPNKVQEIKAVAESSPENNDSSSSSSLESHPGILLSPMVGTAYLAPEPAAAPFVTIGDEIKTGQTVLIIEAMKTLNQIPATKSGVVKRILVEDGTPVEFGSPLVIIE